MQRGYGYPQQRNSSYRYQGPSTAQYESFFNPIPIDFLQQNLAQHQGQYDQAFAGALAAKEAAAQQEIALGDEIYRNQLVDQSMQEMDKLAEQYGGDYGRAAKGIARKVTNLRSDPFWNTSKYLKEQQGMQQKYLLENPNAHLYNDVMKMGAIDPDTGQVRTADQLTFEAEKKGDWQGSVEKQFADLQGDQLVQRLRKAGVGTDYSGTNYSGYMGQLTVKDLSADDIDDLLRDSPQMVSAFVENNPDFKKSKMRIEGLNEEEVLDEAKNFILGNISDKPYREEKNQLVKDWMYEMDLKAQASSQAAASGIVVGNSGDFINLTLDDPKAAARQIRKTKEQLDKMPDGPQKEALQAQFDKDIENREFIMSSVQNSSHAVNFDPHYESYSKWAKDNNITVVSRDEFEERVFDAVREGDIPERDSEFSAMYGGGYNLNNAAREAGRDLNKAMKGLVDDGQIAMNVNVLSGETGRKDVDTYVGRLNNEIETLWKDGTTGFTIPYSNRQIEDLLREDKRYNGKKKNRNPRDPSKDKVLMTDGLMAGKPVYQLNIYDENGNKLGSEYISPDNTTIATGNTLSAARELMTSGDPTKIEIGRNMAANHVYQPSIQKAEIYKNSSGTFQGLTYGEEGNIKYKKVPGQDAFQIHTGTGSNPDDYFTTDKGATDFNGIPVDPKTGIIMPTTEKQIQQLIMEFTL